MSFLNVPVFYMCYHRQTVQAEMIFLELSLI